jgi:hypothetical protein
MKRYQGGTTVQGGYYWNLSSWEITPVEGDVGRLPNSTSANFLRLPLPLLFAVVPLMGALFAFFLPALGFVMVAWALAKTMAEMVRSAAGEMAATVTPAWRPGEAHFAGKPEEKVGEPQKVSPALEKLSAEIAQRRAEEEKKS